MTAMVTELRSAEAGRAQLQPENSHGKFAKLGNYDGNPWTKPGEDG